MFVVVVVAVVVMVAVVVVVVFVVPHDLKTIWAMTAATASLTLSTFMCLPSTAASDGMGSQFKVLICMAKPPHPAEAGAVVV